MALVYADAASLQVFCVRLAGARTPAHVALSGHHVWLWLGRPWVHFHTPRGVFVTSSPCPSREGNLKIQKRQCLQELQHTPGF